MGRSAPQNFTQGGGEPARVAPRSAVLASGEAVVAAGERDRRGAEPGGHRGTGPVAELAARVAAPRPSWSASALSVSALLGPPPISTSGDPRPCVR